VALAMAIGLERLGIRTGSSIHNVSAILLSRCLPASPPCSA